MKKAGAAITAAKRPAIPEITAGCPQIGIVRSAIGDDGFTVPLIGDRVEAGGLRTNRQVNVNYGRVAYCVACFAKTLCIYAIDDVLPVTNAGIIAAILGIHGQDCEHQLI